MNGWTEDDATDVRTRDLAERRRVIMGGGYVWPAEYPHRMSQADVTFTEAKISTQYAHAHPRRIDWYRVAALTIVTLAFCAALVAFGFALVYVLTAF